LQQKHTLDVLHELVSQAPDGLVNLDWLLGHLDRRSFGLILLMLGLLAIGRFGRSQEPSCVGWPERVAWR
jgi:hypothetical protein